MCEGGCVTLCPEKKRRKRQNKVSNFTEDLLDPIVARPISPNWYAHPLFFLSSESPHQIVPKNARKNITRFFGPRQPILPITAQNHTTIKFTRSEGFSVFTSKMMLNGPKSGLTYTQNDCENWHNIFTMFVFAGLHVLVIVKGQQARYPLAHQLICLS